MKAGLLTITLLVAVHVGSMTRRARADVDVAFQPAPRTVDRGVLFELQLIAASDSDADQTMSAMDVVLTWNPLELEFVGVINNGPYSWLIAGFLRDALNDVLDDGDAKFTALANFSEPAVATPDGLLVATFRFRALTNTDKTLIRIVPSTPTSTATQVFGAEVANQVITGVLLGAGIMTIAPSDCDGDADFDLGEFHRLQTCFTGAVGPRAIPAYPLDPTLCCGVLDRDDDGDVDDADFEFFTGLLAGPGQ